MRNPNQKMIKIGGENYVIPEDVGSELNRLYFRVKELEEVLRDLNECPYCLDPATIPHMGVDANPEQVVGTMSIGYLKWKKLQEVLK